MPRLIANKRSSSKIAKLNRTVLKEEYPAVGSNIFVSFNGRMRSVLNLQVFRKYCMSRRYPIFLHFHDRHAARDRNGWASPHRRKQTLRKLQTTPPSVRPPTLYDGRNHAQRSGLYPTRKRDEHNALCSCNTVLLRARHIDYVPWASATSFV